MKTPQKKSTLKDLQKLQRKIFKKGILKNPHFQALKNSPKNFKKSLLKPLKISKNIQLQRPSKIVNKNIKKTKIRELLKILKKNY